MGRQWNTIIESLGPLSGGTGLSINANLTELEALVTTLQADVADGVSVTGALSTIGTMMVLTSGSVAVTNGTVTPRVSTTGGTGPTTFTSTSYGTIATSSTARLGCTIFNEGAGNLHILLGTATASTSSYTVRLSAGDYYEVPFNYTGLIGGIFATAGTARVTQIS
jgi:hypothetical protein